MIMIQLIKKFFEKLTPISEEEINMFVANMERKVYKRNSSLLSEGKVENYLSFIESGIVRYWIERDDREICFDFIFEGSFFSAYPSFLTKKPTTWNIQTLTPTVIWRISYSDLQLIYKKTSVGERIGRLAAEQLAIEAINREISLLTKTPEERYLKLFSEYPLFIQSIPLKHLASFIGVTPQALSRIRKRIS